MKKTILLIAAIIIFLLNVKAIKVKFMVTNMSVNVAEGSIGIFTSFKIYPNSFKQADPNSLIKLFEFPTIDYNNIAEVKIEKMLLNSENPFYSDLVNFTITPKITHGKIGDEDIIQGNTYVYRIVIITNSGEQVNLLNKSASTQLADPTINCAKFNNVYRKSCHNCFQESIFDPDDGGFYQALFETRVVELDVHSGNPVGVWNWEVRHNTTVFCHNNCNNCNYFGSGLPGQGYADGDAPFGVCINDIKMWHNNFPNHDPIILHIDLKDDWDNSNNHTPMDLDTRLQYLVTNIDDIYKPRDLLGNNNNTNHNYMRTAAQQNNWPSMGDLKGKLIFVLTGNGSRLSTYISTQQLSAIAFTAASVTTSSEVANLPNIWTGLKDDIVFYNMNIGSVGLGNDTKPLNYISRVWSTSFGSPGNFSSTTYSLAIQNNINNIAVRNIEDNFTNLGGNGIQTYADVATPILVNNRIYSNYQNVTQAATQHIIATNLVVEQGTHYRMMANDYIDLQPGVDFQPGSDVDVRIDDCMYADYTQRKVFVEPLTQEEIDALMYELNKELYGYTPEDEEEIVSLTVYPNPTPDILNVNYTNFLLNETVFNIYDLTGRMVKTKKYVPQHTGNQKFSIDVTNLKAGTYFYTLQVGEKSYNGKVVKMGY